MSEKSLDQLITSLKTEGIDAAEKESRQILEAAKEQARQIVQAAEEKRSTLLAEAKQEADAIKSKGEAALRQAGRDYSIALRNELLQIFQSVFEAETRKEFTPDLMKTAIVKVMENIGGEVELQLSPAISKELADYVHDRLKTSEKTVSRIKDNSVLNGFSVTQKDQGWSYDITPEEVAAALGRHLTKHWMDILKNGAKS